MTEEHGKEIWIGAGIVLLALVVSWFAFFPNAVGTLGDDAVYAIMAKAFAAGKGLDLFRHADPTTLRFPPVYPLLLAFCGHLLGTSLSTLQGLSMGIASACGLAGYFLLRRYGLGRLPAALIALSVVLNPLWFSRSSMVMSDGLFTLFILLAIPCIERLQEGRAKDFFYASLWVAAAILTRYIGVLLALAGLLTLWRHPKRMLLFGLSIGAWLLPWGAFVWLHHLYGYGTIIRSGTLLYSPTRLGWLLQSMALGVSAFSFSPLGWLPWGLGCLVFLPVFYALWHWRTFAARFAILYLLGSFFYLVPFATGYTHSVYLDLLRFVLPVSLILPAACAKVGLERGWGKVLISLFLVHLVGLAPFFQDVAQKRHEVQAGFPRYQEGFAWIREHLPPDRPLAAFGPALPEFYSVQTDRATVEVFQVGWREDHIAETIRRFRLPYLVVSTLSDNNGRDISNELLQNLAANHPGKLTPLFNNQSIAVFGTERFWKP